MPLAAWVRSVEVLDEGAVVHRRPDASSPRRGTVRARARLPALAQVFGRGCSTGAWVQVELEGYVCGRHLALSTEPPGGVAATAVPAGALLPEDHAFVTVDGAPAYAHLSDYDSGEYAESYGRGFGVILTDERVYEGVPFVRTRAGYWLERDAVRRAQGSTFRGVHAADGRLDELAWVRAAGARVYDARGRRVTGTIARRAVVHVAEDLPRGRARLTDGRVVRAADLARVRRAVRPSVVGPAERWLDVDLAEQTLVAYEGDTPVFATLVSTGRRAPGQETPRGEHRIWVKLASSDMDDLEREDVERNYAIEEVPWVQFFAGGSGLHAAFWHDDFGRPKSHGCVNLSPADAAWLFDFTAPALPPGWLAMLPTERSPGTVVRVR